MIAQPDETADTMLDAIAYTLAALQAASKLDVDRTDPDRHFFSDERTALQAFYDAVHAADDAHTKHKRLKKVANQACIVIGDVVLDRGVRSGKVRMKLELKGTSAAEGVDHVFPSDISDITDAERQVEP